MDYLSATLDTGIIGLLGPNGAGKTTLLRCICGVYKLNGGSIQGEEDGIGYFPQQFGMFKALSVYQMMEYLATLKEIPKQAQKFEIERCVELVNLSDRLRSRISTLSGGITQLRVLSSNQQPGTLVAPTMEDGYLCAIKGY